MARRDNILSVVSDYATDDLVSIVGSINGWDGSLEEYDWRSMDMWDVWQYVSDSSTFEEIVQRAADGEFDPRDDYYRWGFYGLESSDCPDFDLDEIADWIDDHFDELEDILGNYYASDFDDCDKSELDPEVLSKIENDLVNDEDRMDVNQIAATIRECAYEGLIPSIGDETIQNLAEEIHKTRTCLDPADVIAAVAVEHPGAA